MTTDVIAPVPLAGISRHAIRTAHRALLEQALGRAGGNVSRAARSLGLSQADMWARLQRLGVAPDAFRGRPAT